MKYFLLTILAIFRLGESTLNDPYEDIKSNSLIGLQVAKTNLHVRPDLDGNAWTKNIHTSFNDILGKKFAKRSGNELILVKNMEGLIISIIDAATSEPVTSYRAPDLAVSSIVVVDDTVYNIVTENGTVQATTLTDLMTGNLAEWEYVGFFPKDPNEYFGWIISSPAVIDGIIYFVTPSGILYGYDMAYRSVIRFATLGSKENYASFAVLDDVLYIFHASNFYAFDGTTVTEISPLPDPRRESGIFALENSVCIVGGNETYVEPSPVQCYDPVNKNWTIHSYINEARLSLGVTTSKSGVHIFAGWSWFTGGHISETAEFLNLKYRKWGYTRNPFLGLDAWPWSPMAQAITFIY